MARTDAETSASELEMADRVFEKIRVPCVSIFGSARAREESEDYETARSIAFHLAKRGFGIITGGSSGIMQAANRGAADAQGVSVGLHIRIPNERPCNSYLTHRCDFSHFATRKMIFAKYSKAYVVMPGGMGTVDELSDVFVLTQTRMIGRTPIVLVGSGFWNGFLDWMKNAMVSRGLIERKEIESSLFVADTPDEAVKIVESFSAR